MSALTLAEAIAQVEAGRSALAAVCPRYELFLRGGPRVSLVIDGPGGAELVSSAAVVRLTLRCFAGDQVGIATGPMRSAADLEEVARRALAQMVPLAVARPKLSPAPAPWEPGSPASPRQLGEFARQLCAPWEGHRGVVQSVLVGSEAPWTLITDESGATVTEQRPVLTRGLLRYESAQGALLDGVLQVGGASDAGWDPYRRRVRDGLEGLEAGGPEGPLEPGLPVVMQPPVAAPLVSGLGWILRGDVVERTPGMARAVGKKIFPGLLTLIDAPPQSAGVPSQRLDDEGQPAGPVTLIEEGKVVRFLHCAQTAHALSQPGTGRGLRPNAEGEATTPPLGLTVCPGTAGLPPDRNELDARLEMFTHLPRAATVTLIAAGWVVRGGRRVRRIRPTELQLPVLQTLRTLVGVGPEAMRVESMESIVTPALHFSSLP